MKAMIIGVGLLLAAGLAAGCNTRLTAGGSTAALHDSRRPKSLDLPQLVAPQPVAAARVVHLFFTANVAGEIEPCG